MVRVGECSSIFKQAPHQEEMLSPALPQHETREEVTQKDRRARWTNSHTKAHPPRIQFTTNKPTTLASTTSTLTNVLHQECGATLHGHVPKLLMAARPTADAIIC